MGLSLLQLCFCYSSHLRNAFSAFLKPTDILSIFLEWSSVTFMNPDLTLVHKDLFFLWILCAYWQFHLSWFSIIYCIDICSLYFVSILRLEVHGIKWSINSHIFLRIECAGIMLNCIFFFLEGELLIINCSILANENWISY